MQVDDARVATIASANLLQAFEQPALQIGLWLIVNRRVALCGPELLGSPGLSTPILNIGENTIIKDLVSPGRKTDRELDVAIIPTNGRESLLHYLLGVAAVPYPLAREETEPCKQFRKKTLLSLFVAAADFSMQVIDAHGRRSLSGYDHTAIAENVPAEYGKFSLPRDITIDIIVRWLQSPGGNVSAIAQDWSYSRTT